MYSALQGAGSQRTNAVVTFHGIYAGTCVKMHAH